MYIKNANVIIFTDFTPTRIWSRNAGPYRIATEVRQHGYTCQVVDCFTSMTEAQVFELIDGAVGPNTLMIGISTTFVQAKNTNNNSAMKRYLDRVKSINPNTKIVIGGFKALARIDLSWYADAKITGLADRAIVDYLKFLENKNPFFTYTVNEFGQICVDGDKCHPLFDFQNSFIKYEPEDNILENETMVIEISRGCIFNCKFCSYSLNGKRKNDYIKNPSVLRDEFIRNYEEYGITKYIYSDDTHNDNTYKLSTLADIVQSLPFKLEYSTYLRLDLLKAHPEQYELLKAGGLRGAFFGIETLNHEAAKLIGKGIRPEAAIAELHKVREQMPDVAVTTSYIIGLPKETKESIYQWTNQLMDPNFPTDGISLNHLSLTRGSWKVHKSTFEIEANNYVKWKEGDDYHWIGEHFDQQWAKEYTLQLTNQLAHRFKIAGLEVHSASHGTDMNFSKQSSIESAMQIDFLRDHIRARYIEKLITN